MRGEAGKARVAITARYVALRIGQLALVRRVDVATLLRQAGTGQIKNPALSTNSKAEPHETAKHTPERGIREHRLVA